VSVCTKPVPPPCPKCGPLGVTLLLGVVGGSPRWICQECHTVWPPLPQRAPLPPDRRTTWRRTVR
jgi:hypothetical protein